MLFASVCWATGTVLFRNAALPFGPLAFNAVLLGGTWLLLLGLATGEDPTALEHAGLVAIAYLRCWLRTRVHRVPWLLKHAPPTASPRLRTSTRPLRPCWLGAARRASERTADGGTLVVLCAVALVTLPAQQLRRGAISIADLNG